jgi:hypothetical protein
MNTITWEEVCSRTLSNTAALLDSRQFIAPTPMTMPDERSWPMQDNRFSAAARCIAPCKDLMHRIFTDFTFQSGFTTVATPVSLVMKERKGVCQDFAHLSIACLRSLGLPARYVSGYIETIPAPGKEKLVGWMLHMPGSLSSYPDPAGFDFDPTNNQLPGDQHITIGWGRDYADITPLRGVIMSSGRQS